MEFVIEERVIKDDHSLWVEKYRPATIDRYIGNEEVKEKFAQFLKKGGYSSHFVIRPRWER